MGVAMLQPGTLILNGKYRIEELVGKGAFAEVYRATHLDLKVARAIKVLRVDAPGVGSTTFNDYRARYKTEFQIAAQIDHPNVIKVYDFAEEQDVMYAVLEYAPGGSVKDLLARQGALPIDHAIQILSDCAAGLDALHEKLGVIHRDVKPANILLDAEGRAKIADLGLAQVSGGQSSMRSELGSTVGMHPGTPNYRSPEHNSWEPLTPTSDVYSLGCVAFEILTGKIWKLAKGNFASVHGARPSTPEWLDTIVTRMLRERPGISINDKGNLRKRYVMASELITDLRWAGETKRTEIHDVNPTQKARGRTASPGIFNRRVLAAGTVVVGALCMVLFLISQQANTFVSQNISSRLSQTVQANGSASPIPSSTISMLSPTAELTSLVAPSATLPIAVPSNTPFRTPSPAPSAVIITTVPTVPWTASSTPVLVPTITPTRIPTFTSTPTQTPTPTRTWTPMNTPTKSLTPTAVPSKIAFVTNRDGNEEIYLMNPNGTDLVNLSNSPAGDGHPSWAPGAKQITFHSNRSGDFEIYVMDASGKNLTRLTNTPGWDGQPTWSPDGKKIAFESTRTGKFNIYVMNADGSQAQSLTNGMESGYPAWSPDSTQIAFHSAQSTNQEIYTINLQSRAIKQITHGTRNNWMPVWSPDGQEIYFSAEGNSGKFDLYRIKPDGSGLTQLTNTPYDEWWPVSFSPDRSQIAYVSKQYGNWDIFLMSPSGANPTRLTNTSSEDLWPVWSK